MKCFEHGEVDAVGVCRWCGKALCPDCAVDTGCGLSCRGSCEDKVMMLGEYTSNEAKASRRAGIIQRNWAVAFLIAGILCFSMAGVRFRGLAPRIAFGLVFLTFSVFAYFNSRD